MAFELRIKHFFKFGISLLAIPLVVACGSPQKQNSSPPSKMDSSDLGMSIDDGKVNTPAPNPIESAPKQEATAKTPTKFEPPKAAVINFGALAKSNRLDQLRDEAMKVLVVNANDPAALNALAFSYFKKNKPGAARIVLERANDRNPNTPQILTNLAVLDLADNEPARALTSLKKSYKLDDHNPETLAMIGSIYIQNRDYAKALLPLEQSYRSDKTNIKVANNYAVALTKTKSYEAAQKVYDEIMVQNARDSEVLINYASLLVDYLNKPKEGLNLVYKVKFIETERQDVLDVANKIELRAKSALK